MDYSDFYCCADCGFHFVDGNPKYIHSNQYKDCNHLHKEKIDGRLVCLRCGFGDGKEEVSLHHQTNVPTNGLKNIKVLLFALIVEL